MKSAEGLIPLNMAQETAVNTYASDDRLWTTEGSVRINLRTFARTILKLDAQQDDSKELLDWLENKRDTLAWDDADFWTVWDGSKATTGNNIREAIRHAIQKEKQNVQ